jgi:hypothetical protein
MSKKMMSILLTLLFTCLAFFGLGEFGFFRAFFPERLSNHCQGLRCTFYDIFTKFDAHLLSDPL